MRIFVNQLSEEPTRLHFGNEEPWIVETIRETEEHSIQPRPPTSVDMELRRSQGVVFLKGKIDLQVGLVCSRCAKDFVFPVASRFQALYTHERGLADANPNSGVAHSEQTGAAPTDLEIELLNKEYIELADVLKEQIYLQIPLAPLCNEDCKGICAMCGQDQNVEPCQCHRLRNPVMAQALKKARLR